MDMVEKYDGFDESIKIAQDYSNQASDALSNYSGQIADELINLPQSILHRVV